MIIQSEKEVRNKEKCKWIALLNSEFFGNIELTKAENEVLLWLCGWDDWTIKAMVSVFRKVRGIK